MSEDVDSGEGKWRTFAFRTVNPVSATTALTWVIVVTVLLSLSAAYPASAQYSLPGEYRSAHASFKGFSGFRRRNDSSRLLYIFDQTIAVIEVVQRRVLVNCELIEIYKPDDEKVALRQLRQVGKVHKIDFKKMMKLMRQCHQLDVNIDELIKPARAPKISEPKPLQATRASERQASSIFSGIIPGTLWCGTGDIAETYFDLGQDRYLDKCCRSHDLCPVKVQGSSSKYNITNNSIYTKSHCECDKHLLDCLRDASNSKADLMGNIYYNILRVQCVQDGSNGKFFTNNPSY